MNFSRYTIWVQQRPAGQTLPTWTCLRVPLWLPVSRESLDERGHAVHNSVKGRRTKRRAWRRRTTAAKGGGFEDRRGGGVQRRPSKVDAESSMVAGRGTTRLNRSTSRSCATCRWPRRRLVKGPCASCRGAGARPVALATMAASCTEMQSWPSRPLSRPLGAACVGVRRRPLSCLPSTAAPKPTSEQPRSHPWRRSRLRRRPHSR